MSKKKKAKPHRKRPPKPDETAQAIKAIERIIGGALIAEDGDSPSTSKKPASKKI